MSTIDRREAVRALLTLVGEELVVCANGLLSREAFAERDRAANFYMIGSMGLAGSIGLGLALTRPERRVLVLDGDGNLLMGLGALATIADAAPRNLLHAVIDDGVHATTGGQRASSAVVDLGRLAGAAGYRWVRSVDDDAALPEAARALLVAEGPAILHVRVERRAHAAPPRVSLPPEEMAERFRAAASGGQRP